MDKAVIMAIDDETEVLDAVERDLRRHFRAEYRIVKAGSARQALDTTRRLKERDLAVALFLVDERMPQMSGTEFLTEARKLYPDARKVLLTAYADTQAAIAGINSVGLDYYLMKPWDPPDQHLYPVLDDLLSDWTATYRPPFNGVRVAGTTWSPQSHAVKDFLARQQIPYRWIDIEADDATRELVETLTPGLAQLPVVLFPDGQTLLNPTVEELAERVGLQTRAQRPFYDLIVVGGGPSGLAASVYGAAEGLRTILLETEVPGGRAGTSSYIENYLGFPNGIAGGDLARRATTQARRFGAEIVAPRRAVSIRRDDPYRIVALDDGTELSCYALLIATGMSVQKLDVPEVEKFVGAGVYYGAALSEAVSCAGQDVFVIGGADSAGQAAMILSRHARRVTVLVRAAGLSATMSHYLAARLAQAGNVEVLPHARVVGAEGDRRLAAIHVATGDGAGQQTHRFPTSHVFIFIGAVPRSEIVADLVLRDERGFVLTGPDAIRHARRPAGRSRERDPFLLETSVPGVFAAGDVRHGSTKRVAAAVGEGSAVVSMIRKYLEAV